MDTHTNCRYCRCKILLTASYCHQCGAPNEPEPTPWYLSMGKRIKAAFSAKTESVWADRLASLMPLQFILSCLALYLSLNPPTAIIVTIISIVSLLSVLVYYPGWYKAPPEKRKEYGLVHFIITLVQLIIVYVTWR